MTDHTPQTLFTPPFECVFTKIVDANGNLLCDVRGWGRLTGGGAMRLSDDEAAKIQDEYGEHIAKVLTEHWNDQ